MKKIVKLTEGQLKKVIENTINENSDYKIISIQRPTLDIDIEREFGKYKYPIAEHEPIKLSDGNWLHTYKVRN